MSDNSKFDSTENEELDELETGDADDESGADHLDGESEADEAENLVDKKPYRTRGDAVRKAMDYLAMRDHSRGEIATKLKRLEFAADDIAYALDYVQEGGWLLAPDVLAQKVADQLHRKKKSHFYIQNFLRGKQLPAVTRDRDIEFEKAMALLKGRLSKPSAMDRKKIAQFLKYRGFDPETIRRVIHETAGNSKNF